jgi:type VI secretion system secreted protein Hcp
MKYLYVEGTKQGKIEGGVTQKGREKSSLVHSINYQVESSTDKGSGAAASKRVHGYLVVTTEVDSASPLFWAVATNNEILKTVTLDFFKMGSVDDKLMEGKETLYYKIELKDARIAKYRLYTPEYHATETSAEHARWELNEMHFAFKSMTTTHVLKSKSHQDDWATPQ